MTKSYFFWGIYEGNDTDETWRALHEHFEKLASKDDDASKVEFTITERQARKAVKHDGL